MLPPRLARDYEIMFAQIDSTGPFDVCQKIRRKADGKILVWFVKNYGAMVDVESDLTLLVSRADLLHQLRHPHILRHYDLMLDRPTASVYVVVEYCEVGDMRTLIDKCRSQGKHLDEEFIWKIIWQLGLALHEFHGRNVPINMRTCINLEPTSVFMDERFNAKSSGLQHFRDSRMTSCYISPEQTYQPSAVSEKSDVWSLGCLVHELCSLKQPFPRIATETRTKLWQVRRLPPIYSDDLDALVKWMLTVEIDRRLSMEKLMHHPRLIRFQSHWRQNQPFNGSCLQQIVNSNRETPTAHDVNLGPLTLTSSRRHRDEMKIREQKLIEKEKHLNNREEELNKKKELIGLNKKEQDDREEKLNEKEKNLMLHEELILEKYKRLVDYLNPATQNVLSAPTGNPNKLKSSRRWSSSTLSSSRSSTMAARHHVQKKLREAKRVRFVQAELDGTVDRENETSMEEVDVQRRKEYQSASATSNVENRCRVEASFNTRIGTLKTRLASAQRRALRLRTAEIESRMITTLII